MLMDVLQRMMIKKQTNVSRTALIYAGLSEILELGPCYAETFRDYAAACGLFD